jgi:DNA repair protein RadD
MTSLKLRDYQQETLDKLLLWLSKNRVGDPCIDLPTGSGKSVVIAGFCLMLHESSKRVLVLCRQKELVQQNAERLSQLSGGKLSVGIYCAGLGCKDTTQDVIFATVQSVTKNIHDLGAIHAILVDEAHQIPAKSDSQYGHVISEVRKYQPKCRLIGLTASPYRTSSGLIYGEGKIFTDCAHAVTLKEMLDREYITKWVLPDSLTQVDVSNVKLKGSDYDIDELSEAFIEKVEDNAAEILAHTADRKRVLVFATSIAHARALHMLLGAHSPTNVITGNDHASKRDSTIRAFKQPANRRMFLINVGVLTTGFDAPNIDSVVICRATKSAGLFYQILGRGMRLSEGKDDFLVLDFGGNFEEHGDPCDLNFGRKNENEKRIVCPSCEHLALAEDARCSQCGHVLNRKSCPQCAREVPLDVRVCDSKINPEDLFSDLCKFDFTKKRCRMEQADGSICLEVVTEEDEICPACLKERERRIQEGKNLKLTAHRADISKWVKVVETSFAYHTPKDEKKNPTLRVTYSLDIDDLEDSSDWVPRQVMEWVCLEHEGFAKTKADKWWSKFSAYDHPATISEAMEIHHQGGLREPFMVLVQDDGKWKRIVAHKFRMERPESKHLTFGEDDDCPF